VFDGCQVTDAHFLRIVLGGGKYNTGAIFKEDKSIKLYDVTLYSSVEEAEATLPNVFADHLGLRRYRDAVQQTLSEIPLAGDDGKLMIFYPVVDEKTYWATGPFAADNEWAANAEESADDN